MAGPYTREKIENWVSDFCSSDRMRDFSGGIREYAQQVLVTFLVAACQARNLEPDEIEEQDVKAGLLGSTAKLALPASLRNEVPALCGAFLGDLQQQGRLGGGRMLGAYAAALKDAYLEAASGKPKPITRPGSRISRNDPCPCGSGRKYKKCCMERSG